MRRGGWVLAVVATFALGFGAAWLFFAGRGAPPEPKPIPAPRAMPRFAPPPVAKPVEAPPPKPAEPPPAEKPPPAERAETPKPKPRPAPPPPPVERVEPARPPVEAPEEPPPASVSFQPGQVWRGEYVCAQGATDLEITIDQVAFDDVRAIFAFRHGPTGAQGAYRLHGRYDPRSRHITFEPGEWIEAPPNYFPVGMSGRLSMDGRSFSGRITDPSCTSFLVRLK